MNFKSNSSYGYKGQRMWGGDFWTGVGASLFLGFSAISIVLGAMFLALLLALVTTFAGGVAGWIVGWFFTDTILGILSQIGINNVTMFQVGAFLGFISCFFKQVTSFKK